MPWFDDLKFDDLKIEAMYRGRFTPVGRCLLSAAAVVTQPVDWYVRRSAATAYNRDHPSTRMTAAAGYAILPAGTLPGTSEVVDTCRRLFERKQAALADAAPGKRKGKQTFLKNMLDDGDLKANPILVEFALSDALFSVVTNYFGSIPTLNRVDLLHSFPRSNPDEHISSQLFHQDHEGLTQAKVFLNVYDVAEEHGPFTFISATETDRVLRAIRAARRRAGAEQAGHYRDDEVIAHGGLGASDRLVGRRERPPSLTPRGACTPAAASSRDISGSVCTFSTAPRTSGRTRLTRHGSGTIRFDGLP